MSSSGSYYNPYSDKTFFGFFFQLFHRVLGFVQGDLTFSDLVSDEIQIIVLIGVASSSAIVGSFLVLRKMTMLANSLSHTILLGIVIAFILTHQGLISYEGGETVPLNIQAMLLAALIMGIVTTFLTEFLTKVARLQEDASMGIVFTSLFALGIILATVLTRNAHIGTETVMGNVDALHLDDCKLIFVVLAFNLFSIFLFFKEFKITTFDPGLSRAFGVSTTFFNYLLMAQVSATTIGAFRAVGVLMVLAFMTGPVLAAQLLMNDLKKLILTALLFGCAASVIGVALSRHFLTAYGIALSTAGVVVCTITMIFLLVICFTVYRKRTIALKDLRDTNKGP